MTQSRFISTVSGRQFHFAQPTADMIDLEDIAHALSNLCRFTGQCSVFYSVAEHSIHVSRIVPEELALVALLHDATEAYCADLARPLKQLLPEYSVIEDRIWGAVAGRFGLPVEMPPEIKQADMAMLKREVMALFPEHVLDDLDLPGEAADVNLNLWSPPYARACFMRRFSELTKVEQPVMLRDEGDAI